MMHNKILKKEQGSELMLYDAEADEVHILNPTARLVYELCAQRKGLGAIEHAMRKAFRAERDCDILLDIRQCLIMLKDKKLV